MCVIAGLLHLLCGSFTQMIMKRVQTMHLLSKEESLCSFLSFCTIFHTLVWLTLIVLLLALMEVLFTSLCAAKCLAIRQFRAITRRWGIIYLCLACSHTVLCDFLFVVLKTFLEESAPIWKGALRCASYFFWAYVSNIRAAWAALWTSTGHICSFGYRIPSLAKVCTICPTVLVHFGALRLALMNRIHAFFVAVATGVLVLTAVLACRW